MTYFNLQIPSRHGSGSGSVSKRKPVPQQVQFIDTLDLSIRTRFQVLFFPVSSTSKEGVTSPRSMGIPGPQQVLSKLVNVSGAANRAERYD
jgi:hypothetical protein